ncbi:MAG: hypothetical protein ISR76_02700 [Planctomycetes bacterium]|nr:hypothetical protein [Planctomycetota bacterium]
MPHSLIAFVLLASVTTPDLFALGGDPVAVIRPQDPPPSDPLLERLLPRFHSLPAEEQQRLVERAYQAALGADHPLARAAAALEGAAGGLAVLEADPQRSYSASQFAPALKLGTTVLERDSSSWKRTHQRFFPLFPLPDRSGVWEWDYGRNALLKPAVAPSPEQRLKALLAGDWPDPGRLAALAEARFDGDGGMDAAADYFAHHYRDRDGRVYSGMRLDDVWGSGREIEVSDVEAIAYLRLLGGDDRLQSPIPARLHDGIYRRISDAFAGWRDYRQLRQALAARLCAEAAELPLAYRGLSERIDQVWGELGHDPERVLELLRGANDRPQFFAAVAAVAAEDKAAPEERAGLGPWLRLAAETTCREEGLLGLGRR